MLIRCSVFALRAKSALDAACAATATTVNASAC